MPGLAELWMCCCVEAVAQAVPEQRCNRRKSVPENEELWGLFWTNLPRKGRTSDLLVKNNLKLFL